jgi:hypothetical protein
MTQSDQENTPLTYVEVTEQKRLNGPVKRHSLEEVGALS